MSDDNPAATTDVKIPKRLRYEVLRRDRHTCRYCGASAPDVRLTVDHVLPRVLGGTNDPTNLVTACADCNSGKTSIHPDSPLVAESNYGGIPITVCGCGVLLMTAMAETHAMACPVYLAHAEGVTS